MKKPILIWSIITFTCVKIFSQGFSPLYPGQIRFSSDTTVSVEGSQIIVSLYTWIDGQPLGGFFENYESKRLWMPPDKYGPEHDFAINNGIIGRSIYGQMLMISYDEIKQPYREKLYFEWAIQGSMLIYKGKVLPRPHNDQKAMYSAITYRADGAVQIYNTMFEPQTLDELVAEMHRMQVENAMLLDVHSDYNHIHQNNYNKISYYKLGLTENDVKLHFRGFAHRIVEVPQAVKVITVKE